MSMVEIHMCTTYYHSNGAFNSTIHDELTVVIALNRTTEQRHTECTSRCRVSMTLLLILQRKAAKTQFQNYFILPVHQHMCDI